MLCCIAFGSQSIGEDIRDGRFIFDDEDIRWQWTDQFNKALPRQTHIHVLHIIILVDSFKEGFDFFTLGITA